MTETCRYDNVLKRVRAAENSQIFHIEDHSGVAG